MKEMQTPAGLDAGHKASLTVGWAADQVPLQFLDMGDGKKVDHGKASGRIANACRVVEPFHKAAVDSGKGSIMNPPITLPTPGKADVVVTILADPDAYEICFVGDVGFYDLATPLYDVVDWKLRGARGADGAPPPKAAKKFAPSTESAATTSTGSAKGVSSVKNLDDVKGLGADAIVLDFGAGWCDKCTVLKPFVDELASKMSNVTFAMVDVDDADDDLAEEYSVTAVPHFVMLKGGQKVSSYVGSTKVDLESTIKAAFA
jgi:thioredoxin 1